MKTILLPVCLSVLLFLAACRSDDEDDHAQQQTWQPAHVQSSPHATAPEAEPPLSPAEKAQAAALVDFYNTAASLLAEEPYTLPDALLNNAHAYLQTWRLKPAPRVHASARETAAGRLAPPPEMFTSDVRRQLLQYVNVMGAALETMPTNYRLLEKYVKDDSIRDDNAGGNKIITRLETAHTAFVNARDAFLTTTAGMAAQAEATLLRDNPLKRQIVESRKIFSLFKTAAALLKQDPPDKAAMLRVHEDIETALTAAERPPFQGDPETERVFRAFLKEAATFPKGLAQGFSEGFHSRIRHNLNTASHNSRETYNAFVRTANRE